MKIQIIFREDEDKDLIEWYKNARKGDRSVFIREAIRKYCLDKTTSLEGNMEAREAHNKSPSSKPITTKALDMLKEW